MMSLRIALVAPTFEILGGHAVQMSILAERLQSDEYSVTVLPINPQFPKGPRWVRRYPYVRTLVIQARAVRSACSHGPALSHPLEGGRYDE